MHTLPCRPRPGTPTRRKLTTIALITALSLWGQHSITAAGSDNDDQRAAGVAPISTNPTTNWYAGFGAGATHNSDFIAANDDGSLSALSADKTSTSWRVFGGYRIADQFALEAGYLDLGKSSFTAQSSGGESWSAGAVGTDFEGDGWFLEGLIPIPLAPRWTLYARLGILHWETTETFFEETFGTSVDKNSGTDVLYGVAIEYDVGVDNKWVWRGEATQTRIDDDHDTTTTAGMSLVRKF